MLTLIQYLELEVDDLIRSVPQPYYLIVTKIEICNAKYTWAISPSNAKLLNRTQEARSTMATIIKKQASIISKLKKQLNNYVQKSNPHS